MTDELARALRMAELWKRVAKRYRRAVRDDSRPHHTNGGHGCHDRPRIQIDPATYSGRPTVTWRIPPEIPCAAVWDGYDAAWVTSQWPAVTRPRLLVACWYLGRHGSRVWQKRWRAWADDVSGKLWSGDYDVPLPPTRCTVLASDVTAGT